MKRVLMDENSWNQSASNIDKRIEPSGCGCKKYTRYFVMTTLSFLILSFIDENKLEWFIICKKSSLSKPSHIIRVKSSPDTQRS
jgi:hypothetical protein